MGFEVIFPTNTDERFLRNLDFEDVGEGMLRLIPSTAESWTHEEGVWKVRPRENRIDEWSQDLVNPLRLSPSSVHQTSVDAPLLVDLIGARQTPKITIKSVAQKKFGGFLTNLDRPSTCAVGLKNTAALYVWNAILFSK